MKKLLSVLFALAFAMSVTGFAFAADNAAMPMQAEKSEKAEKKAEKKPAKKSKKAEKQEKAKKAEMPEKAPEAAPMEKK